MMEFFHHEMDRDQKNLLPGGANPPLARQHLLYPLCHEHGQLFPGEFWPLGLN